MKRPSTDWSPSRIDSPRPGTTTRSSGSWACCSSVFRTVIRYHESAAVDMRRHGLLPYELEQRHAAEKSARLARLRAGIRDADGDGLLSRDAAGLSADYAALADEVVAAT